MLKDHLSACPKNPDVSAVRKPIVTVRTKYIYQSLFQYLKINTTTLVNHFPSIFYFYLQSHRRKPSNSPSQQHIDVTGPQQHQNNFLFTMLDGISTLRSKIEYLENNLSTQHHSSSPSSPSLSCQSCPPGGGGKREVVNRKRSRRSQSEGTSSPPSSKITTSWASVMEYFEADGNHAVYLKVGFFVVLVSIYLMTAKLFYTIESSPSFSAGSSASCENRAFGFAMKNIEKTTQALEDGFHKLADFHIYDLKVNLNELQSQEKETAALVPSFYHELNRTIVELDQRFHWIIEQSRDDIKRNITWFDDLSLRELSIDNVVILVNAVNTITNHVWRRVMEEINFTEFAMLRHAGMIFEQARQKYFQILEKAQFSVYETSKRVELKGVTMLFEGFARNVTQRVTDLQEDQIKRMVQLDLDKVRKFYDQNLRAYYANATESVSHQSRLQFLTDAVQNRNLKNGRFVWQLNATRIQAAERSKVFHSIEFQSGSSSTARLYMYRDRVRKGGFWKVSFVQTEQRPVKIWMSVLSQVKPELLLLHEDIVGSVLIPLSRSKRMKVNVVKHFSVSMNTTELVRKGYIVNGNIFIRCLTTE